MISKAITACEKHYSLVGYMLTVDIYLSLSNQSARKVLFTCLASTNLCYLPTIRPMEVDFLFRPHRFYRFFCRVKIFHRSSQIVFFQQRSTRKRQDWHLTVLKCWNGFYTTIVIAIWFSFSIIFWTILTIWRYAVLWSCGTRFQAIIFRLLYGLPQQ